MHVNDDSGVEGQDCTKDKPEELLLLLLSEGLEFSSCWFDISNRTKVCLCSIESDDRELK